MQDILIVYDSKTGNTEKVPRLWLRLRANAACWRRLMLLRLRMTSLLLWQAIGLTRAHRTQR